MKLQIINATVGKRIKYFYKRKETNLKKHSTSVQGNRSLNPQCGYVKTYPYLKYLQASLSQDPSNMEIRGLTI